MPRHRRLYESIRRAILAHRLPVGAKLPSTRDLAYELGHGKNVVNVALVDLRGWDTMGELSVLILAATGVASLVFVTHRSDTLSRSTAPLPPSAARTRRPLVETEEGVRPRGEASGTQRMAWLVGGQRVRPENRSILLEVIVRILFHSIIIVSLYVLFAGHNLPGGGFAGGLIAGMALVMRYVAGGRYELGAAAPTDAGRLLGAGMSIAVACAIVPLFFGAPPLTSFFFETTLPVEIWNLLRAGLNPKTNAVGALVFGVSIVLAIVFELVAFRKRPA